MNKDFLEYLGIDLRAILPSFFGALLWVNKEGKSWKQSLLFLFIAIGFSTFTSPFVVEFLGIKSKHGFTFISCIVAFGCYRIAEFYLIKFLKVGGSKDAN